jgi:hypothetical protein
MAMSRIRHTINGCGKTNLCILLKEVSQMDRVIISAAITHIRNAKEEIEKLPRDRMNRQTRSEIEHVCHALDDSISHCQDLFGSAGTQNK